MNRQATGEMRQGSLFIKLNQLKKILLNGCTKLSWCGVCIYMEWRYMYVA